jgi:3-deoxy-D-manno-octulosonate 8-phosphate phosphatase KdsC-like HAD superfamily phosphatase
MNITNLMNDLSIWGGVILSAKECTKQEIDDAKKSDRFASDGLGFEYIRKSEEWLTLITKKASKAIRYRAALIELVGESNKEELEEMKKYFEITSEVPTDERKKLINAINVLLEDI